MDRSDWGLDEGITFLNHGSFGATPRVVLAAQSRIRAQLEADPVRFLARELEPALADLRAVVGDFVGADGDDIVFVRNATEGINAVLRSLRFEPGDEIVMTDHGYNAVNNCVRFVAERAGARVVTAAVPFPLGHEDEVMAALERTLSARTRLVVVDHVTSATGMVFPVRRICARLAESGIEVLVDGAHGPGMLALELRSLKATFYAANFHKWVCAPKGAAMLYVDAARQADIVPTVISHGYNSSRARSRFLEMFDWTGTSDPSALLAVPVALRWLEKEGGGWDRLRARHRELLLTGRDIVASALDVPPPVPDRMLGSLASLPLPEGEARPPGSALYPDELQLELFERFAIEVPVAPWPCPPRRLLRISAFSYNSVAEYRRLADALKALLPH
ncbi:MAG: aminotransferase class V-fold PLP-dependent enzyme [Myxococcota bacterium]